MPDITNELKIDIMHLAFQVVCNDESIADQPKNKNGIGLYHAMIKAVTDSGINHELDQLIKIKILLDLIYNKLK